MDISEKLLILSSALLMCIAGYLSISGIFTSYSYWWDELFSVVAASLSMPEMFEHLIFRDVHPPLYQVVLHAWVTIFGASESATRILSLAFVALAVLVFAHWCLRNLHRSAAAFSIVAFTTSYLSVYYAQESRSYAMMLFLATLLTAMYLEYGGKDMSYKGLLPTLAVAAALSLTHYFGLVYAGLIIIFCLYWCWGDWKKSATIVLVGLICLVWPVLHFIFGTIGQFADSFWITSNGFESTIAKFAEAMAPQILVLEKFLPNALHEYVLAVIFTSIFLAIAYYARQWAHRDLKARNLFVSMVTVIVLFVLIVTALDYRSPVSTPRNFIVLLPAFSILAGLAVAAIVGRRMQIATVLIVAMGLANLAVSYVLVNDKQQPLQNHANAAEFIIKDVQAREGFDVYYTTPVSNRLQKMMATFYFDSMHGEHDIALEHIEFDQIFSLSPPYYVFMPHQKNNIPELISKLKLSGLNATYYEPTQSHESGVVVIYAH